MTFFKEKHIWIIGASSGIGAALARELAQRGARLLLSARRVDKLADLALETGGQSVLALDVADAGAVQKAVDDMATAGSLPDIVINLAAVYQPMSLALLDTAKTAEILQVNLGGSFNVTAAVVPHFVRRKTGMMVLCGSVAGFCGLPNGQPYSATKAGVINLAESLRAELRGSGIEVKVINPGFVRTDLTAQNSFDMPAMIEPAVAAKRIADGLTRKGFEIHFPKRFTLCMKLLRLLPYRLYFYLMRFVHKG
jgi:short-subunit dehydrogenase